MNLEQLIDQFELVTDIEEGLEQLRKVILKQAIRGNLTNQDPNDEPAEKLLKRVQQEKQKLYDNGEIRKPKDLDPISEDEKSYKLPEGWRWSKIGHAYYIEMGQSPPSKYYNTDGEGLPFYQGKTEFGDLYPEPEKWCSNPNKISYKGDVLISVRAPVGPTNICQEKSCIGRGLAAIRPLSGVSTMYTLYCMRSFEENLSGQGSGSTFKAITKKNLLNFILPIPPKEEQRRIVQKIKALFSQVDELEQKVQQDRKVDERLQVAVLDDLQSAQTPEVSKQSWRRLTDHFEQIYRKPEHIDQLKQAILNEAVRGRLVPQDPSDEPAEILLERIKEEKQRLYDEGEIRKPKDLDPIRDDEIPYELPNQWCWARIGTACPISGGKRVPKGYSLQDEPTPYIYIRVTDMKEGTVLDGDLKYISEEVRSQIAKYTISKDDLYITIAGTIGDVGSIPEKFDGMNLTENAAKIQLYLLNKDYLQKVLNSPVVQTQFFEKVNKMAQPKLALKRIRSTIFPMPPLEEQERIIEKVEELFTWCDDLKEKLSRSQQTDQRLLEALVNGKVN